MNAVLDEFKQRQRAMWAAGDYPTLSEQIADVGELLTERAGVKAGMQVLDVACGSGNATLPAARRGAEVTGLDLVPELLAAGRAKAAAEGLEITWVEGDAESLTFADASFERVFSTFGHMFAPRHRETADEMARVCREGGLIGICCWTPEGVTGDIFRAAGAYMPPPPDYASPPLLWGTEDHVREMFGSVGKEFEFERHSNRIGAAGRDCRGVGGAERVRRRPLRASPGVPARARSPLSEERAAYVCWCQRSGSIRAVTRLRSRFRYGAPR
jgi:2-polyprenyl-6-hydroxyphenyl methylase/3-demethylubiquinone-9 3-methyltransferase